MDDTWVMVADGNRARLFKTDAGLLELTAVKEWSNGHHAAGHRGGGANPASGHGDEEERFARELAHDLDQSEKQHAFRSLVLAAPPRFLGSVRGHLGTATLGRLGAALPKDLAEEEVHALAKHLRKLLADNHHVEG